MSNSEQVKFKINKEEVSIKVDSNTLLSDCIRHQLLKTGTHVGCEHGACGACTVILDGDAVRSCLILAKQADGCELTTVEGLSKKGELSNLQLMFKKHHALQCGFCTPGMLTTAHALLSQEPSASYERIKEVISGNICRCTGYINIIDAVYEARDYYR
ncbi:MAG: (2Fe-2S)-binding protein [Burkholderiaceae bacterium]